MFYQLLVGKLELVGQGRTLVFALWAFASVSNQPNCSGTIVLAIRNGTVGSHPSFPTQKTKGVDEIFK